MQAPLEGRDVRAPTAAVTQVVVSQLTWLLKTNWLSARTLRALNHGATFLAPIHIYS